KLFSLFVGKSSKQQVLNSSSEKTFNMDEFRVPANVRAVIDLENHRITIIAEYNKHNDPMNFNIHLPLTSAEIIYEQIGKSLEVLKQNNYPKAINDEFIS